MMRVLGLVPARGGSKGIPGKNLAVVAGRPLLAYTAAAARASTQLDRTIVSTDDAAIAAAAATMGLDAPFLRPSALAGDEVPMLPVLRHALAALDEAGDRFDVVVLLQPTSPLRRAEHIDAAVEALVSSGADSVVSVVEVPHQFNPVSVLRMDEGRLCPYAEAPTVARRQDKPRLYARNGPAVLAVRRHALEAGSLYGDHSRPLVMSARDSLDVDDPWDLHIARLVLAEGR